MWTLQHQGVPLANQFDYLLGRSFLPHHKNILSGAYATFGFISQVSVDSLFLSSGKLKKKEKSSNFLHQYSFQLKFFPFLRNFFFILFPISTKVSNFNSSKPVFFGDT